MKLLKGILALSAIGIATLTLASCDKEEKSTSYVTLEINPGVELVVDENENIVSANGLNDDGKSLIIDVDFTNLKLDAAINLVINEAEKTGYIVSADAKVEGLSREISVSVSAETTTITADLEAEVKSTVEKIISDENLQATYNKLEAKQREYFEAIAKSYNPALTDEELAEMNYNDLMDLVELATIEKAQLASIALEEYYLEFKEYEFQFKYKEEIAAKLQETNKIFYAIYNPLVETLKSSVESIEKLQYDIYVSEDSEYLKLINKLHEYKDQNITLKYQLSVNGSNTEVEAQISSNEELINQVETQIKTIMDGLNQTLETAKLALNTAIAQLNELEKTISNIDYEALLTEVETQINAEKTSILEAFEAKYNEDIETAKSRVQARKDALTNKNVA